MPEVDWVPEGGAEERYPEAELLPPRDVIVVGASAGGFDALKRLVAALPADLAAAVLVVLHLPPDPGTLLSVLLNGAGRLPARDAENGEPILPGTVYIAPPDRHLLVERGDGGGSAGRLRVERGPKINHSRPAADPLFLSAARALGPRVAGVILSGTMNDGSAGLWAVRRQGGLAIVQDPDEAAYPGMPRSALAAVGEGAARVLPVAQIARLLARVAGPPESAAAAAVSVEREEGVGAMSSEPAEFDELPGIARANQDEQVRGERSGIPSVYSCPDCGGTLWQADAGTQVVFRCHVGHAYTAEILAREQRETLERSLWYAARTLTDRGVLLRQLAANARNTGNASSASHFEAEAVRADRHGDILRQMISEEGAELLSGPE